jgi:DNA-binding LytR/AlgR family response regulator
MVIKLEQNEAKNDIEILITYPRKSKVVERLVSLIKSVDAQIPCFGDSGTKLINASAIYYVESVDKRTIIYYENGNGQTKERLYQIYEKLADSGFVQINKYCILNINKLDEIKPLVNSRMEALLSNGIRLHVTRKYLADIKRVLQEIDKK